MVNEELSNTKTKTIIKDVSIVEVKCKMEFRLKPCKREIRSGALYMGTFSFCRHSEFLLLDMPLYMGTFFSFLGRMVSRMHPPIWLKSTVSGEVVLLFQFVVGVLQKNVDCCIRDYMFETQGNVCEVEASHAIRAY